MKLKLKIVLLVLLSTTITQAQTKKKLDSKKATPVASTEKPQFTTSKATTPIDTKEGIFADIQTSKGSIVVKLEYQKTPITVANFVSLAEGNNPEVDEKLKGKHFYDGLKFHRVIKDFMIQGGDPDGNGSGGPGYAFKDEITDAKFDNAGILAMANAGPKTNGSQFFITHKETPWLNGKHTIFGYVVTGQNVVNAIAQDDVITKIVITRKGDAAKKFDAAKVFGDYFITKAEDDRKQVLIDAENKKKQAELDAQKKAEYTAKYGTVMASKIAELNTQKQTATKTASGLQYVITKKGEGKKPAEGTQVYVHYAGYLEDGSLFDSSYEDICKTFGKYDSNRASQNGYQPFPFQYGNKGGLIPGFLEGLNLMSFGDKAIFFIPSNLGYGERGAGNVIPPNSNIIFEVELLESLPSSK
ncbi:peptidylprolyl isomerase [Flavobacterium aciduliphilum]|uniref:peptidylprolyl isomerase n=1 Tax=Flavobacterium aciduliphilum TaxID=1101402 RepID=A0A328Y9V5_9FLAO|nr:peptidylprolyl isomerase [Flavobacterium aciduliphilum]RAR70851.1 cyclophilin family peptidyl-prolyl cis-trans isomerase [Flavobacterium aciduliphilum]